MYNSPHILYWCKVLNNRGKILYQCEVFVENYSNHAEENHQSELIKRNIKSIENEKEWQMNDLWNQKKFRLIQDASIPYETHGR